MCDYVSPAITVIDLCFSDSPLANFFHLVDFKMPEICVDLHMYIYIKNILSNVIKSKFSLF